mgnify:CR=1 FL=1
MRELKAGSSSLRIVFSAVVLFWASSCTLAQKPSQDLSETSLEALMNTEVTSASRKQEKFITIASAIFVIRPEDIRRSAATNIPDLLRMVPGLEVAHIDANKWAISARGFNGRFANKLLVLIDGRAVYSPLFSGVYWDVQDVMLEDIERIEVIRGPGGTVWGANAVNGVINIITRAAKDTQGGLLSAGAGNHERGFANVRYGGHAGSKGYYRIFLKYFNRGPFELPSGQDANDQWQLGRGGFRADWQLNPKDSLTLDASLYGGRAGLAVAQVVSFSPPFEQTLAGQAHLGGGYVLARWRREVSKQSNLALQVYYDRSDRSDVSLGETRHTVDLDFTHRVTWGGRHDLVWGLGFRYTTDQTRPKFFTAFDPASRHDNVGSGFVQDEIALFSKRLRLTLGSKFEHNELAGFEFQPSVRASWSFNPHHAVWGAISRAVRTPSRVDRNVRIILNAFPVPGGPPTVITIFGDPAFRSEHLLAYELGYRLQPGQRISLDLAAFYNRYTHLQATRSDAPFLELEPAPPHVVLPLRITDRMRGETHGAELAGNLNLTHSWRFISGLTFLREHLHAGPGTTGSFSELNEGDNPAWQIHLRSLVNLPKQLEWDTSLHLVGTLASQDTQRYARLDMRLGWRPTETLELSVVLQNLTDARHQEFNSTSQFVRSSLVRRGAYAKFTWSF